MNAAQFQSALNPAAAESAHIVHLWWIFFWVTLVIFALVAVFLLIAILRNIRRGPDDAQLEIFAEPTQATETRGRNVVSALVIVTVLILFALLIADFITGNAIYATPAPNALAIKITGHQWWWEVEYKDPQPSEIMTTANELHVPIGKTVKLELQSADLTHIASRKMLGAGELPNTRGYLAGWILNASALKPGVHMPPTQLSSDDLNALLDYLESLK